MTAAPLEKRMVKPESFLQPERQQGFSPVLPHVDNRGRVAAVLAALGWQAMQPPAPTRARGRCYDRTSLSYMGDRGPERSKPRRSPSSSSPAHESQAHARRGVLYELFKRHY